MNSTQLARTVLVLGLAFVFGYFGIDKFLNPLNWVGFMPVWMNGLAGQKVAVWLSITGAAEIVIAILLLIPVPIVRKTGAVLAVLHLIGVLSQVGWNDVAVRDIGLLLMAVAVWLLAPMRRDSAGY